MNLTNINVENLNNSIKNFHKKEPFSYCVIDNFIEKKLANKLSEEIPNFNSDFWHEYNNAIEIKKTCNDWNKFPPLTYSVFSFLNSEIFIKLLENLLNIKPLYPDNGLNGGGWHIHANGGKLNPHLDYSLHPKLKMERKLNIILYLEKDWQEDWGGHLGLYSEKEGDSVKKLEVEIEPKFNRAVIFDTTQNSWHGISRIVKCKNGHFRKSMAVYYLTEPSKNTSERGKALFSPTEDQEGDKEIANLIKDRSSVENSSSVYRK
jgi:hypothetical protein